MGDGERASAGQRVGGKEVEWDATAYHRISEPQFRWGLRVLDRLSLRGDEVVMDAGCGSGRLTAELCARLPRGRVIAVDQSQNMLEEARRHLAPRFGDRVTFRAADLQELAPEEQVDGIFSTATFHWVHDHARLFRHLHASIKPGGWIVAQCGGAENLERLHDRATELMRAPEYAPYYEGWADPWEFPSAEVTAERLRDAGFVDVETDLEPAPATFPDAEAFKIFVERVVLRHHLGRLPDAATKAAFLAPLVEEAGRDEPPYTLDYIRLNLHARRPAG